MFEPLIDRLQKLLSVKSIVTIALTIIFCILCLNDMISSDEFMTIFTVVIAFYFGTQAERKSTQANEISEGVLVNEEIDPGGEKNKIGFTEGTE